MNEESTGLVMAEYAKMFHADGEPVECECCNYPGRVSVFPNTPYADGQSRDFTLCEVCSQTYLSIAVKYPRQCPDSQLYRSIAVIGNMLLEAIRGENP